MADPVDQSHDRYKAYARGYQTVVLLRREEETGERDPAAWKQDPVEFMTEIRAELLQARTAWQFTPSRAAQPPSQQVGPAEQSLSEATPQITEEL